jgi:hypothetical protein
MRRQKLEIKMPTRSKQEITDSKIGGKVHQRTDAENATQSIANIETTQLQQRVSSNQETLILGKYRAKGLYAVLALVLIIIAYFLFKFALKN